MGRPLKASSFIIQRSLLLKRPLKLHDPSVVSGSHCGVEADVDAGAEGRAKRPCMLQSAQIF